MNDERLAELRALSDAATPGPWARGKDVPVIPRTAPDEWGHDYELDIVAVGICESDNPYTANPAIISSWGHDADGVEIEDNNATFIAASRTAVPELLDAIERIKSDLAKRWTYLGGIDDAMYRRGRSDGHSEMEARILTALNGTEAT